jgi:shikimate kinase
MSVILFPTSARQPPARTETQLPVGLSMGAAAATSLAMWAALFQLLGAAADAAGSERLLVVEDQERRAQDDDQVQP